MKLFGVALLATIGVADLQTPAMAARPRSDVITVKETDPAYGGFMIDFQRGNVSVRGFTVNNLIAAAYDVDIRLIAGGPKWAETDKFDILAEPKEPGTPTMHDVGPLLVEVLTDRFGLKIHRETRRISAYLLTVGRNGPKMTARRNEDGGEPFQLFFRGASLPGRNVTMKQLTGALQSTVLDRPVLDKTRLAGSFDFNLAWRPEPDQFRGGGASFSGRSQQSRHFQRHSAAAWIETGAKEKRSGSNCRRRPRTPLI